jgi:phage I-like protein
MTTAIGVCQFQILSGDQIQLLPAGLFRSLDGRPDDVIAGSWRLTAQDAALVIAAAAERINPYVIDYEHQTLMAEKNGQPAPAAGWWKAMSFVGDKGLLGTDVQWTPRARQMIDGGEYKYISPVFLYDKTTGAVLRMLHAALTNNPGLDGMKELASQAALRYLSRDNSTDQPHKEHLMDKTKLAVLLGLAWAASGTAPATADNEIEQAITALKAKADKTDGLTTEVAALKGNQADPTRFVPISQVEDLKTQLAALSARINGGELDNVVAAALTAGKLLPAQEQWARELGAKDLASLKGYIEKTPAIAALSNQQTNGRKPGESGNGDLSDVDLAVCKQLGLSAEDYKKNLAVAQ